MQHLVLSGGLENGLVESGVLSALESNGSLSVSDLESIYATSVGVTIAAFLCIGMHPEKICNYLVDRPIYKDITNACHVDRGCPRKGVLSGLFFRDLFRNVFLAEGQRVDMTLGELYLHSGIELHAFTVGLDGLSLVDLNWRDTPDIPVWKAAHMSGALPGLFEPAYWEGRAYIDGGIRRNFPLPECMRDHPTPQSIYGITTSSRQPQGSPSGGEDITMFEYLQDWVSAIVTIVAYPDEQPHDGVEILRIPSRSFTPGRIASILAAIEDRDARRGLVDFGKSMVND
jgi:predicted acylesterase/phospholipase RssA